MNEYNKKAEQFLKDTNTEFKAEFLKNGLHFEDDKEPRDIYLITLTRENRIYKFNFGQSINNSGKYEKFCAGKRELFYKYKFEFTRNKKFKIPTAYDVLSCLQKSEIGTFKDFCEDFGYDEDSRKAEKTYKAVVEEFKQVKMLWSDSEIEKLQEIQ